MKTTLKLYTLLIALASVFTFSSCLDSSDDSNVPAYYAYVTITGDSTVGYTFYSDNGSILVPTSTSVEQVLPGLNSSVKRAFISFDVINAPADGILQPNQTYQIVLGQSYYGNYGIPTYETLYSNDLTDSLHTQNGHIEKVESYIWAVNGYVNAQITLNCNSEQPNFCLNTFYGEEDIDEDNNTVNLNIYYNSKSENPNYTFSYIYSFELPYNILHEDYTFTTDSINLVLNAITNYDGELNKVAECKVALKDFQPKRNW